MFRARSADSFGNEDVNGFAAVVRVGSVEIGKALPALRAIKQWIRFHRICFQLLEAFRVHVQVVGRSIGYHYASVSIHAGVSLPRCWIRLALDVGAMEGRLHHSR